jgi:hypothetical protein
MVQLNKQEMNDNIKNAEHMQWETLPPPPPKKNIKVGKLFT